AGTGSVRVAMGGFTAPNELMTLATSVAATLMVAANLVALSWFGMWMGLNSKSTNLAALKTILFVQVIPWFALTFVSMMTIPLLLLPGLMKGVAASPSQFLSWYPLLASAGTTALTV